MPHSGATTSEQQREEARLAYVACTRAADHLVIIRVLRRKGRVTTASPFFADLPDTVHRRNQPIEPVARVAFARPVDPGVAAERELRNRLREVRNVIARTNFTLPEAVLSDAEITRIITAQPADMTELARILGPLTANRLGAAILRELHLPPTTAVNHS